MFLLVYELNLLFEARIYPTISIVYLTRYRVYDDLFGYILLPLDFIEYNVSSNITNVKIRTGNSKNGYPEQPHNSCESMPIAAHPNCHLSRWLPLSSHSQSFIQACAVPYTAICCHARRLLQALRPTRFPKLLFAIMHCCLFLRMRLLISLSLYSLPPNK